MARLPSHTRNANLSRSRELRRDMSVSEKVFWEYIRVEKLGFKFRRQHNVAGFYLDFYCAQARVCIEIDGEQHLEQTEYDKYRDAEISQLGILTLRFPSLEIFEKSPALDAFLQLVYETCCARTNTRPPVGGNECKPPSPTPSPLLVPRTRGRGSD